MYVQEHYVLVRWFICYSSLLLSELKSSKLKAPIKIPAPSLAVSLTYRHPSLRLYHRRCARHADLRSVARRRCETPPDAARPRRVGVDGRRRCVLRPRARRSPPSVAVDAKDTALVEGDNSHRRCLARERLTDAHCSDPRPVTAVIRLASCRRSRSGFSSCLFCGTALFAGAEFPEVIESSAPPAGRTPRPRPAERV